MKRITVDYILSREPCYTREELEAMFKGRKYVMPLTVCKEAKSADALWLLLHQDFISDRELHLLACDYAERIDLAPKGKKLVALKRKWVGGKVSDEELEKARATYWSVYDATGRADDCAADRAAYVAADRAADSAAYGAAYWAAAYWAAAYWKADWWADDRAAEREWQLEQVAKILQQEEE